METEKKKNKILIIIVILLSLSVIGFGGYFVYDKFIADSNESETVDNNDSDNKEKNAEEKNNEPVQLEKGTFSLSNTDGMGGYGTLQIEGYARVEKKLNCFEICEGNEEEVDYVYFNILRIENTDFQKFLEESAGNSFVDKDAVGLGCIINELLSYSNVSDKFGEEIYQLSKTNTEKILNSTQNNPVILNLEREKFSYGSGAPTCYSHITTIEVVN